MRGWRFFLPYLTFVGVVVLILSTIPLDADVADDSDDGRMTVYVGSFLDLDSVVVNVGSDVHKVGLSEHPTGAMYGTVELDVSKEEIIVNEGQSYNGTKASISLDGKSAYIWITNYSYDNGCFVHGSPGGVDYYSVTLEDNNATLSECGSSANVAITNCITIDGTEYNIQSFNAHKKSMGSLAAVGINVSAGGTATDCSSDALGMSGVVNYSFTYDSVYIRSVSLWNASSDSNSFLAIYSIETIWLMDSTLGPGAFAHLVPVGTDINLYVGGSTTFGSYVNVDDSDKHSFFEPNVDKMSAMNKYRYLVHVTTDDYDFRSLYNNISEYSVTYWDGVPIIEMVYLGVGTIAFFFEADCIKSYESADVKPALEGYDEHAIVGVRIGDSCDAVGANAFNGMNPVWVNPQGYSLPPDASWARNLVSVGENAFKGCDFIQVLQLDLIQSLGNAAFKDCAYLKQISIPDSFSDDVDLAVVFEGAGSKLGSNVDVNLNLGDKNDDYVWMPGAFGRIIEVVEGNVTWKVLIVGSNATILGVETQDTSLNIPSTLSGANVKTIDSKAFENNDSITAIQSQSVTTIGDYAFSGCSNLSSASFDYLESIGEKSFAGTALNEFNLESCRTLGYAAFTGCTSLTSITLGKNLSSIPEDAFCGCPISAIQVGTSGGSEVSLSLNTIGPNAFGSSTFEIDSLSVNKVDANGLGMVKIDKLVIPSFDVVDLQDVRVIDLVFSARLDQTVPEEMFLNHGDLVSVTGSNNGNITRVNASAFAGCTSLKVIDFSKMEFIDASAFYGCTSLTGDLKLDSAQSVGSKAFSGCGFETISIKDEASLHYDSFDDWNIVESDVEQYTSEYDGKTWHYYVRNNIIIDADPDIEYILVPDDIVSIGTSVFSGCSSLAIVSFGSGSNLKIIGAEAFKDCISLKSISVPDSVEQIGDGAFNNCSALEQIDLPSNLIAVSNNMLRGTAVTEVSIPESVKTIGLYSFYNTALRHLDLSSLSVLESVDQYAFSNCTDLETVILPAAPINLGGQYGRVFQGCSSLSTVSFDGAVLEEGVLKLPPMMSSVAAYSFYGTSIRAVEISAEVDELSIGGYAFYGITTLESVTLTNTGQIVLGGFSFAYNTVLQDLAFSAGGGVSVGMDAFYGCPTLGTDSSGNRIPLDLTDVTSLASNAFGNCTSLFQVNMPSGLTSVAYDAFQGCIMLEKFSLDSKNSTYQLKNDMLVNMAGTTVVAIPTGLQSVTISKEITSFEKSANPSTNSNVFSIMRNLEEILVEPGNSTYVSISGSLFEVEMNGGSSYTLCAVPSGKSTLFLDVEGSLIIPGYVFKGASAKTVSIRAVSVDFQTFSLESDSLRNLKVECHDTVGMGAVISISNEGRYSTSFNSIDVISGSDVTIGGALAASTVSIVSGGSINITAGLLYGAKTVYLESGLSSQDTSVGITLPDVYFSRSIGTLSDLSLITTGCIDGKNTIIEDGYVVSGGRITLGYCNITGSVANISDVQYYIQANKTGSYDNPMSFIIDGDHGVIRQVTVAGSSIPFYISSDINDIQVSVISLSSQSGDDSQNSTNSNKLQFRFVTGENYQPWDLRVQIFQNGSWGSLSAKQDYYEIDNSTEGIYLRVDACVAGMDDTYVRVMFDSQSSISVPDMMVVQGRSILKGQLPVPVRPGYSFEGWFLNSDMYNQQSITNPVTLYAKWENLDSYVSLITKGGVFVDGSGKEVTGGKVSSNSDTPMKANTRYYFLLNPSYEFIGFEATSTGTLEWSWDLDEKGVYIEIESIDGYATISPIVKYYSLSSDLQEIINIGTVESNEDLVMGWAYANNPVISGMSWHNTPGTPLIVDDYVYLHLGPELYKLDVETGTVLTSAKSVENGNFYYHLGYGGSGESWYILDYATGQVFDEDLQNITTSDGSIVVMPRGMTYAKWYGGFFFSVYNGAIWMMNPEETNPNGEMINLFVPIYDGENIVPGDIFSQYGVTSSVLIEESTTGHPTMYWLNVDGKDRYIYASDLSTGQISRIKLDCIRGYFMDDGWLTYYDGHIYTTAYTQGLFGDKASEGNSKIVYVEANGVEFGSVNNVDVENDRNSLLSGFVIVEGRGYLNATTSVSGGGALQIYNISNHKPEFVVEVKSDSSHGGIVVSTANLSTSNGLNGYVNIYMMNYDGSNKLYVFTDRVNTDDADNTVWSADEVAEIKDLPAGFGSQAIRVDAEGRIIFYNDSGALYCYVPAHLYSDYYFLIEGEQNYEVVVGTGNDSEPYVAIEEAIWDSKRYNATYDETTNTMSYANVLRYAYYFDGTTFKPLNTCPNLESLRSIFLLKERDYNNINQNLGVYTTESENIGATSGLSMTINGSMVSKTVMDVGDMIQLSVGGTATDVRWVSSDSSVVRVDSDGNVTAVSLGSALVVVTATVNGSTATASCMVSVTGAHLSDLALNLSAYKDVGITKVRYSTVSFDLDGGKLSEGMTISAGSYEAGTRITLPGLDNSNDVGITKSGYEFAGWWDGSIIYDAGSQYLVGSSTVLSAYWVSESEPDITTITIVDDSGTSYNNQKVILSVSDDPLKLGVTVMPQSAGEHISWISGNPDVVCVENGVITALAPGTVTITVQAISSEAKASFEVTVPGYNVVIDPITLNMTVGGSETLSAGYESGKPLMGSISWSSSNPAVANVGPDGSVTAISAGTAVITATAPNGNTAQCVVAVTTPQVTITGGGLMYIGEKEVLKASATGVSGFIWSSSNPTVATVDQNGNVTAVSEGYATITATASNGSGASASVTVTVQSVKVQSVSLSRSILSMQVGGTQALSATVSPTNAANRSVIWTSSNSLVASVSSAGVVTALSAGTTIVTVTTVDGSYSASCTVTVQGDVTSIKLDQTVVSLGISETVKIGATTAPTENVSLTWRSSDSKVATVDSSGNVKGVAAGTATITVTYKDISVTVQVTVVGDAEVVDKGTVENSDGTKTSTVEETSEAGDSTISKITDTTTDSEGNVVGTEVSIEVKTEGSKTMTVVNIVTDVEGNSQASAVTTIPSKVDTSNGKQTITVSPADIQAAVQQIASVSTVAGEDIVPTVVIGSQTGDDTIDSTVTISESAISVIAESGKTEVRVDTGVGSVSLSSDIVVGMADSGGDVKLSASLVFESELTDTQKTSVSGGAVFSLSAYVGDTRLHELGGTATISLPHDLKGGKAEDVHVYYMDDYGRLTEHRSTYDKLTGAVTFETDHFSYYVVSNGSLLDDGSTVGPSSGQSDDGLTGLLYAVIGLLAVLIAMFGLNMYLTYVRGRP